MRCPLLVSATIAHSVARDGVTNAVANSSQPTVAQPASVAQPAEADAAKASKSGEASIAVGPNPVAIAQPAIPCDRLVVVLLLFSCFSPAPSPDLKRINKNAFWSKRDTPRKDFRCRKQLLSAPMMHQIRRKEERPPPPPPPAAT